MSSSPLDGAVPRRRSWTHILLWTAAIAPLVFVALAMASHVRNAPYWDEYDAVLDFLIALDRGMSGSKLFDWFFSIHNEHRMFGSRVVIAAGYWLTGGVNFAWLAVIGSLYVVALCAALVASVRESLPRARLAAVLGLALFQLHHHENFFWAGASIDHFFVVLCAIIALVALARPGRGFLVLAIAAAFLGTFSLAHGLAIWVAGAALLAIERRWRELAIWTAAAALAALAFFHGFWVNPQHRPPVVNELPKVAHYWLTLVGASPSLGNLTLAPWFGALMIAGLGWLGLSAKEREDRIAFAVAVFCAAGLAMIAVGRANVTSGHPVPSRYLILGGLLLGMLVWSLIEHWTRQKGRFPAWGLAPFAALAAFNLAASTLFMKTATDFADNRDSAMVRYGATGTLDAVGAFPLYPKPERARLILEEARNRGIYSPPDIIRTVALAHPVETGDAVYYFDDVTTHGDSVFLRGWAFRPEHPSRRGELRVVLRSDHRMLAFNTVMQKRKDLVKAYGRQDLEESGFVLRIPRHRIPRESFSVGVAFANEERPTYTMTGFVIDNSSETFGSKLAEK